MRVWVCVLCLALHPALASAGAWLQAVGAGFAAGTAVWRDGQAGDVSLYAEYGLRDRITVGLDLHWREDEIGHGVVFARLPIRQFENGGRLALQVAVGGHKSPFADGAMARAGVLYGRPLGSNGWLGIEASLEHRIGLDDPLLKLDAVAGFPVPGRVQPMIKIESVYKPGFGIGWTVTPQVVIGGKGKRRWVAGVEYKRSGGQDSYGVAVGLWQRF